MLVLELKGGSNFYFQIEILGKVTKGNFGP